ncbi:MAG: class I SAM-dependent methyltransferase [Elusimicrobia bacterium]|nr:class I SAM-dependent methyltransferase [Elusimicrobiota bacterium]
MKDSKKRFTAVAGEYDRFRPEYPGAVVDWLIATAALAAGAQVADIGCGTGISTRLLASRGLSVVGVDPNEAMLEKARARGGEYVRGEAHRTGLPGGAFSLVCAAQAFHWFPVAETLAEWRRLGAPAGWGAAFWNLRDGTAPVMKEYEELLGRFSAEYQDRPRARQETIPALRAALAGTELRETEVPHVEALTREQFLGRAASASYVAHGVADRAALDAALGALFEKHQTGGALPFAYRTVVVAWRLVC